MADPDRRRILHEDGNEAHRLRVQHDRARLYVGLSGEDGKGPWTVMALDRGSRLYAVAQAETKTAATQAAAVALTELMSRDRNIGCSGGRRSLTTTAVSYVDP